MHYYRYRSGSELSFKELLYDEIYFCSPEECNAPFDSKVFYQFPADLEAWKRLIHVALSQRGLQGEPPRELASILTNSCPLSFEEMASPDFWEQAMQSLLSRSGPTPCLHAIAAVQGLIDRYKPKSTNFVSFSRSKKDILMWSHYAANHVRFCLIFKSIDGKLEQCPDRKKRGISRETRGGLAPHMSYGWPDAFPFQDIEYV